MALQKGNTDLYFHQLCILPVKKIFFKNMIDKNHITLFQYAFYSSLVGLRIFSLFIFHVYFFFSSLLALMLCSFSTVLFFLVMQRSLYNILWALMFICSIYCKYSPSVFCSFLLFIVFCVWLLLLYQNFKFYVVHLSILSLMVSEFSIYLIVKWIVNKPPWWNSSPLAVCLSC